MRQVRQFAAAVALPLLAITAGPSGSAHPEIAEQIRAVTAELRERPADATLFLRRGELHRIHRDWDAAERDYRRARALDPELDAALLAQGRALLDAGRDAAALEPLERFVARHPDHADGLASLGTALAAGGQSLRAASVFDRAIATSDGHSAPEVYVARARAYAAAGPDRLDRAIAGLDEGLEQLGGPITLQLLAIDIELERGNPDGALARIDRIAASTPRQETWLVRRAEILESVGRTGEARDAYRAALAAVDRLPASRRSTRAVARLISETEDALARLGEGHDADAVR